MLGQALFSPHLQVSFVSSGPRAVSFKTIVLHHASKADFAVLARPGVGEVDLILELLGDVPAKVAIDGPDSDREADAVAVLLGNAERLVLPPVSMSGKRVS
jgi:hypothetical protein